MNQIGQAISEIHSLQQLSNEDTWINRLHPLGKLILTVFYIVVAVSFPKYELPGLLSMALYPAAVFIIGDLSFKDALKRLRIVLPLVMIFGVLNPFFDKKIVMEIGSLQISGGVVSMITLMIKGILTVLAGYLLIATTSIEKICRALRILHVPKTFVTVVLLIFRYVTVLLSEARRITQAYQLRAPNQKGVHYKVWGSLLGQMLLRSMDRANDVYDSMLLRGFDGEFPAGKSEKVKPADMLWPLVWIVILALLRLFPIVQWIGSFFMPAVPAASALQQFSTEVL